VLDVEGGCQPAAFFLSPFFGRRMLDPLPPPGREIQAVKADDDGVSGAHQKPRRNAAMHSAVLCCRECVNGAVLNVPPSMSPLGAGGLGFISCSPFFPESRSNIPRNSTSTGRPGQP